ncbi:MAG: sigma 54-interacting transcriptional regulator [Planctomycetota bacterium]|nr:sigma 54-interacting transcriptional regulator [Planctomycetota bacterium]MCX8039920.1 sigma 54-interacting transcriptional regulator [Planctomycetota bacterium]MDW8372924.1 sigma 54-interacting transcriptional regulator [Planctomycetota bacterium]
MGVPIAEVILDSLAEGVITVDRRGRITSFNRAAERLTGYERAAVLGKDCQQVLGPCCGGSCVIVHTLSSGEALRDRPGELRHRDGSVRPVMVTTNLLTDAQGRVIGAVGTIRDCAREVELERQLAGRWKLQDLVSRSPRMQRLFELLPTVAASGSTVLILGESGTGKELVARAIHSLSPRAEGPFVAVNCGALPDSLLEAELFGYRAGAFTDAKRDHPGRFARAQGGTIFLDEIGDISAAMQVRLLRVLQERVYEPLGARAPEPADARVIAATHRDLKAMVAEGRFRLDLYYRLDVVRLELPPLRERPEDIPLLAEHFIDRFNRLQNRRVRGISEAALAALARHRFPGNVRELENLIERAFVLCGEGPIDVPHLPEEIAALAEAAAPLASDPLSLAEARALREALRRHGGDRTATARELGIHRTTLYRKLRRYGLLERADAVRAPA